VGLSVVVYVSSSGAWVMLDVTNRRRSLSGTENKLYAKTAS
jgi:hypothetical protein